MQLFALRGIEDLRVMGMHAGGARQTPRMLGRQGRSLAWNSAGPRR